MRNASRKIILLLVVSLLISDLCGCATLKKKFVRKPKSQKKTTPVLAPQDYRGIYPNSVLYNNHLMYWKGWTDELIDSLAYGLSNKRRIQAANLAVEDLTRMQELLKSPKNQELSPYIKNYKRILERLKLGRPAEASAVRMRSDLEKNKRVILRKFGTKEVKDYILKEEEPIRPISTTERKLEE